MELFSCCGVQNCVIYWWGIFSLCVFLYGLFRMIQQGMFSDLKTHIEKGAQKRNDEKNDILDKIKKKSRR